MVDGYAPASLREALELLSREKLTPYAGGTDIVNHNLKDVKYLFLKQIPQLRVIYADEEYVHIGAAVTYHDALKSPLVPKIMKEAISQIGSPAIRNAGTFGGNLANGSDKADSVLIEFVTGARIQLVSKEEERLLDISEFHLGRRNIDLREGELIREIRIPYKGLDNYYYCKIGGRAANAISFVSFAGLFACDQDRITKLAAAFGAAGDAIQRYPDIEKMMIGKTMDEAKALRKEYLSAYESHLLVNQSRVGPAYQKYACMKLLAEFLSKYGIDEV